MHDFINLSGCFAFDIERAIPIVFICFIMIIVASFVDMWTAVDAARVSRERVSSRKLRRTVSKIIDYLRVIIIAMLIDLMGFFFPFYSLPFVVMICTLGTLLIEGYSVIENLRKKKSHAADVLDIATKIIECATKQDAEKIIKLIKQHGAKSSNS